MKPESNRRALQHPANAGAHRHARSSQPHTFNKPNKKTKTRKAKTNGHIDISRKFFFAVKFSAVFPGKTRNPARIKSAHAT